ncbi:MAG: beta strand repeat-containing protein [Burkholderiaceae bacterium]
MGLALLLLVWASASQAQVCAAPGKDSPATPAGIVNTYYQGVGSLAINANGLTLGAVSGAAGTVTVGDLLLVMQMQGASIDSSDDERYGDGTGTAGAQPDTSTSQANGYTALGLAGGYEYVRVTAINGNAVTFTPNLTNAYEQNTAAQPRRTYQTIRVPQYPSVTVSSATPLLPLAWTGLVGGVVAIDVAGRLTFTGAGPHIDASRRGFRGGAQGVPNSACCTGAYNFFRSTATADGGGKGEGIAGTPRYVSNSVAGTHNSGTRFSDPVGGTTDNGAGNVGYANGDFARGAPANAGGGGTSHNSGGGGGGNGGAGGNGGQTFNGDGLRDVGGHGGSRSPQDGVLLATRIFMGGGGGSGSLNNDSGNRAQGGYGGGIVMVRTGSISGSGLLQSDGQRGWDSDASNDTGGGGGAGGSILLIAGSGSGSVQARARGGDGGDSNVTNGSTAFAPPNGTQGACCGGEREGPGGGAGGGAVYSNAALSALTLTRGINGLSREDKAAGFSGNMRASPGSNGGSAQSIASSAIAGARPGYECGPVLGVSKVTGSAARTVPPDTTGSYSIRINNPAIGSGAAYGISIRDVLSSPFALTGTSGTLTYSLDAAGPASPLFATGTSTVVFGTAGHPTNGFSLPPGANLTVTFFIGLNGASAGTYQNPATVFLTDAARTTGGSATGATNPAVTPGGTNAIGAMVPGSNYASGSSDQEDIVITGAAGTTADLALVKTGPASAEVGQAVQYILSITNSGPTSITGSVTVSDTVPAAIGTVTWACSLIAGTADCDTAAGGTGATGSGNSISLNRISIASGGQLQIQINGIAASAGNITNTATVSLPAGFTDPTPANNTGTATTTLSTPSADLSASKSNGVTTVTAGGATAYTVNIVNAGPSSANNAVVTDTASAGLNLLSVVCSAAGGSVCPAGLNTTTFQAGIAVPVFPAGSTLTFTVNVQVTSASGTVTNTVSVTAPAGLTEINGANNTASDVDTVVAAQAVVVSATQICPAGTTEQLTNLLSNSDFADTTGSVGSFVPQFPVNNNAPDTGVAPQIGTRTPDTNLNQRQFPGDPSRSVAAATNWLYSNGNNTGAAFRPWSQAVSGLVLGRTYEFLYYGSNTQQPGSAVANPPAIEVRVVAGTTTFTLGAADSFPNEGAGTTDTWTLRQRTFGATATGVTLQLFDTQTAGGGTGDNFGVTQLLLRECRPNADPFVTKNNGTDTVVATGTTAYVVTVGNNGPGPADSIVVRDTATLGLSKSSVVCAASGSGAQCPVSVTVGGLEGVGLTIPALPAGTTVVLTITASVTALNGSVTNNVSLQLPPDLTDSNSANNNASDTDAVRGVANITISKNNGTTTLVAGGTTAYTLTVANMGPSDASNSVISDPEPSGLSCTTAAVCSASGSAACAASIPIATLQGGYTIPALPSGGQIQIVFACTVTATGQ